MSSVEDLVLELNLPEKRENAARELFKRKEKYPEIALLLWHSPGTIASLITEIQSIYHMLSPPTLTQKISNRICNTLNLFQCVVSCQETRTLFLQSKIPCYLYPFLNTRTKTPPFEYLRLSSLGILKAMVKEHDPEVFEFLVALDASQMDVIPPCLRIMRIGSVLSKRVATYILEKIIQDQAGLAYICAKSDVEFKDANPEVIANILRLMLLEHTTEPSDPHLIKHIVRCYKGLISDIRAREVLRDLHPDVVQKLTFEVYLHADVTTQNLLEDVRFFVENSTQS